MRYFVNRGRLDFKSLICYNNHTPKKPQKRMTTKMTLQQLKYFTVVAECGNITEAGKTLHRSAQPYFGYP